MCDFFTFYHGKSPFCTTIWGIFLFFSTTEQANPSSVKGYTLVNKHVPQRKMIHGEKSQRFLKDEINEMGVSKNRGIPKWMVYKGNPY